MKLIIATTRIAALKTAQNMKWAKRMQTRAIFDKPALIAMVISLAACTSLPALAASTLVGMSGISAVQQSPQKPRAIYRGRVKPEPPAPPHYRQVISESPGYHRYSTHRRSDRASGQRPEIAARFYYQAPSTTVINRRVEVIAPQNATSDVYFNQDTYYLYPSSSAPYHPARRYYPPVSRVTMDSQDTENRAKQWTDKADFGQ